MPSTCEKFLASERILEELELEPLTVPESKGDTETLVPESELESELESEPESEEEVVEDDDEEPPSSLFAHPIRTRIMKPRKDSKQTFFFIVTPV